MILLWTNDRQSQKHVPKKEAVLNITVILHHWNKKIRKTSNLPIHVWLLYTEPAKVAPATGKWKAQKFAHLLCSFGIILPFFFKQFNLETSKIFTCAALQCRIFSLCYESVEHANWYFARDVIWLSAASASITLTSEETMIRDD